MKIREVRVQNLRSFGPDGGAVSFVDATTGQVRPLTVLVGSNGSGKTTVLELLEQACLFGCTDLAIPEHMPIIGDLLPRAHRDARLEVKFDFEATPGKSEPPPPYVMTFEALEGGGRSAWLPASIYPGLHPQDPDATLEAAHTAFRAAAKPGVLTYFPTRRYLASLKRSSVIAQPPESSDYVHRYESSDRYVGSLEQLWVWQNYLDLESQKEGRPSLLPFVETIQTILGKEQRVIIHKARVWIDRPHLGDRVRIDELPSGEQQVLLIFGEIIRRLRPQAIVMIDELEMSLHPALQRVVLYHLRRLAQQHDLQVIVTTHSLEIVAAADPSEIVNLDDMAFVEQGTRSAPEAP